MCGYQVRKKFVLPRFFSKEENNCLFDTYSYALANQAVWLNHKLLQS